MKNIFILLVFFLAFVRYTCAQDSIQTRFGFHVGLANIKLKDEFNSPYTYTGNNFQAGMIYERFKPTLWQRAELSYTFGSIQSAVSPVGKNDLLNFKYDHWWSLTKKPGRLLLSFGPGVNILYHNANYLPDVEQPTHYVSMGAYLTIGGNMRYQFNDRLSLEVSARVPLVGYVYRPDFESNGKTFSGIDYIGSGGLFDAKVQLAYKLNSRLALTVGYQFSYFNTADPRTISLMQNNFTVGIRVRL